MTGGRNEGHTLLRTNHALPIRLVAEGRVGPRGVKLGNYIHSSHPSCLLS